MSTGPAAMRSAEPGSGPAATGAPVLLGQGYYYDQLPVGFRFTTTARTITETDLVAFINLTWFTEELFTNVNDTQERALHGRVVPASLVYCFAEGLIVPSVQFTGLAFLGTRTDVKAPTVVGDSIRVDAEVTESRPVSNGHRGLVRTRNTVVNQHGTTVLEYEPLRLVAGSPWTAPATIE
jgi:acyl dehydratase